MPLVAPAAGAAQMAASTALLALLCACGAAASSSGAGGGAAGRGPSVPAAVIAPGVKMPLAGLGTARGCPPSAAVIAADIKLGMEAGFTAIDTATLDPCYNDTAVGHALKGVPRADYFLISKIPSGLTGFQAGEALEYALAQVGVPYVDLMLIHHPNAAPNMSLAASVQAQWAALEAFHKAGKAKAIGVSNFCNHAMEAVLQTATIRPAVNQVLYHAGMGPDPDGIVSFARQHKILVQAFSPTDEGNPVLLGGEPYKSIGAAHNKSGLQVAFRWLTQRDPPVAYVTAADKLAYLQEDLDTFDFDLTAAEIAEVDKQQSCKAGVPTPCAGHGCKCFPYWPGPEDCCNVDAKGGHCKAW